LKSHEFHQESNPGRNLDQKLTNDL